MTIQFASMRPRQMPRNFGRQGENPIQRIEGFNEAAADAAEFSLQPLRQALLLPFASMRPRQMPRNFSAAQGRRLVSQKSFNEAAADAAEFCTYFRG